MIKNFIKRILILAALVILTAYSVPSIMYGIGSDTIFLWELVLVSCVISVAQLLLDKYKCDYYIIDMLIEYLMVCLIVSVMGLLYGWFKMHYLWMVLLYVTPIYIIGYFLDMVRIKRDVNFINKKIEERMEKGIKNE
jgi:hypothetical protein